MNVLFPKVADNNYQGYKPVKWLLYVYVLKSFVSGAIHMFASDGGAEQIASVKLSAFSTEATESIVTMFGLFGMEQFVIGLIALVIIFKYRSLIPMLWLVYAVEYLGRFLSRFYTPGLATVHEPPGAVADFVLVPLAIVMFAISLKKVENN